MPRKKTELQKRLLNRGERLVHGYKTVKRKSRKSTAKRKKR